MPPPASGWMRIGELSRRTGVSADRLRVWERRYGLLEPRRTQGNVRLYSGLDEARVRLMTRHLDRGVSAAQAAELARAASFSITTGPRGAVPVEEVDRSMASVTRSLLAFDEARAEQVLQQLLAQYSATAVIRDLVLPCLRRFGELWASGEASVAHEHFATHFMHSRLLALARGWDHNPGPRAILACAPLEQHTIGLIAFGIALHRLGWRIAYLGAQTPLDALWRASEQLRPALLVISATIADSGLDADGMRRLAGAVPLALGGAAMDPETARAARARLLATDPIAAAREIVTVAQPGSRTAPARLGGSGAQPPAARPTGRGA